jgi:hypothetical protein
MFFKKSKAETHFYFDMRLSKGVLSQRWLMNQVYALIYNIYYIPSRIRDLVKKSLWFFFFDHALYDLYYIMYYYVDRAYEL